MGQNENAVTDQDTEDLETLEESPDVEQDEATGDEAQEGEEGDGQASEPAGEVENEIVLEGDTQPQADQVPVGFYKRINKLNGDIDTLESQNSEANQENLDLKEENKLLRMAVDRSRGGSAEKELKRPNPDDFDGGTYDPKYIDEANVYMDAKIAEGTKNAVAKFAETSQVKQTEVVQSEGLKAKQKAHFERAAKLKIKDYAETEDKAIEILGTQSVNHLIGGLKKDTEKILYHLGKFPDKAHHYAEMFKTRDGTIEALVELGRLVERIKVKPKKTTAPGPDNELEGGGTPEGKLRGPKGAKFE